jgi:murein DD-endopeptidase MepM/ murein hydrolase activator NlpD
VEIGDHLFADDLLGGSGGDPEDTRSGNSSGPHLHFGVISEGAYERKETYLKFDFMNPWIWLENWATEPVSRRRVKADTWLNVRNAKGVEDTVVRFTMNPLTEFDIWFDTGGVWPWGCQDISRTAWNSIHGNWTEPI